MAIECIWKYLLESHHASIEMPQGARILTVQMQGDTVCLWACVDPNAPQVARRFVALPTGAYAEDISQQSYLGTVQRSGYVWHVFEAKQS
jgi:hypothetical protein